MPQCSLWILTRWDGLSPHPDFGAPAGLKCSYLGIFNKNLPEATSCCKFILSPWWQQLECLLWTSRGGTRGLNGVQYIHQYVSFMCALSTQCVAVPTKGKEGPRQTVIATVFWVHLLKVLGIQVSRSSRIITTACAGESDVIAEPRWLVLHYLHDSQLAPDRTVVILLVLSEDILLNFPNNRIWN